MIKCPFGLEHTELRTDGKSAILKDMDHQKISFWGSMIFLGLASAVHAADDSRIPVARAAADAAVKRLKVTLMEKMEHGGLSAAIPFCHSSALPITVAETSGQVTSVKRATLKPRNPKNRADATEEKLLKDWQGLLVRKQELPKEFAREEKGSLHYYRPIRLEALCLSCHGVEKQISPEALQTIRQQYPADQAVGYSAGDLRGLIHVVVK